MVSLLLATVLWQGASEEMRLMRQPDVYGNKVVFTYAGDLWVWDRGETLARRLTSHPASEAYAQFSPDGTQIAFTGYYDGNPEIYVVPVDGGEPRRLTIDPENDIVVGWTPQGEVAYKSTYGNFNGQMPVLWKVSAKGGPSVRLPIWEIGDGSFSPDGKALAYNRTASHQFNWRRYRGGTQGFISIYEFDGDKYWELPHKRENSWFPMWVGDAIYYASDRNLGTVNLYRYDLKSKQDKQLTSFTDADVKWPKTDGKTIVFERDGQLYAMDIASGKIDRLAPRVLSDNVAARPSYRALGGQIGNVTLSPSGARVAVEARGELFSVPKENGETRNLTNTLGARERFPAWSPDGQTIAFASDRTGEYQIYTVPQLGGEPTQVSTDLKTAPTGLTWSPDSKSLYLTTRSGELFKLDVESKALKLIVKPPYGIGSWDVSADGKWIAYCSQQKNLLNGVFLYEVATGKATQVTDGYYDDSQVAFDLSGEYLYVVSARTFNALVGYYEIAMAPHDVQRIYVIPLRKDAKHPLLKSPDEEAEKPKTESGATPPAGGQAPAQKPAEKAMQIDIEGMAGRAVPLPMPNGSYQALIGLNKAVAYYADGTLFRYGLGEDQPQALLRAPLSAAALNASRTKIAYLAGGNLMIADLRPGAQPQRVDTGDVAALVDLGQEWKQLFWEAWRYMRDNFYDPSMVGVDWKAVGDQYAKYLPYVKHRADLSYVLGLMVGELGTGHAYVGGGDMGYSGTPVPMASLGCDYAISGDHVIFQKIYRGANYDEDRRGPLAEPGVNVKEGDYLLAIDGRPVDKNVNPANYLLRKAGRTVVVTVNDKPTLEGARKERVRPIASEAELRYWSWVEETRKKVSDASGGRIGYMHLPNTQFEGITEFMRGFWSQVDKDAVIVDERWNGGGFIQPWFVATLARRVTSAYVGRNFDIVPDAVAMEGPKCLLINQYAGSGGDLFPWTFKHVGLGPLIGKRTWGGLVGISGFAPLIDGGGITAPEFGLFDKDLGQWIAENKGIDPDIDVDLRPDAFAKGRDLQLEKAIEYLMNELKKNPPKPFKRPPFPTTVKPPSNEG